MGGFRVIERYGVIGGFPVIDRFGIVGRFRVIDRFGAFRRFDCRRPSMARRLPPPFFPLFI
jgi:hypothetical protein